MTEALHPCDTKNVQKYDGPVALKHDPCSVRRPGRKHVIRWLVLRSAGRRSNDRQSEQDVRNHGDFPGCSLTSNVLVKEENNTADMSGRNDKCQDVVESVQVVIPEDASFKNSTRDCRRNRRDIHPKQYFHFFSVTTRHGILAACTLIVLIVHSLLHHEGTGSGRVCNL